MVVSSVPSALLALLFLGLPSLWAPGPSANRKGTDALRKGDYPKAAAEYQKAIEALPGDKRALYNRGTALLAAGQLDPGLSALVSAAGDPRREVKSASFYNAGNGLFGAQKLKEAVDAYKQAILADPNDQAAKFNYELAQRRLDAEEEKKEDQQQQQNQDQQQQQQNQEQQQQQQQQQDQAQNQEQESPSPANPDEQQPRPEESQEQKPQPVAQMSKEQAEQLLDALQQNEKEMIKARMTSRRKRDVEKDW